MVVFTCNHCGEGLQKPKVEKHYTFVCRAAKNLTCVDCLKDFRNEEYIEHKKCVTEEQRYAAKGSMPNGDVKKGEVKQGMWVDMIKSILDKETNLPAPIRNLLNTISAYDNVPRKKPKFINFIKNSMGTRANLKDIEQVWNVIEKHKNDAKGKSNGNATNGKVEDEKNKKNQLNGETKKRKAENATSEDDCKKVKVEIAESESNIEKFSFKDTILKIVSSKGSISKEKLQKKVLKMYLKFMEESEASPKTIKKYEKKLAKLSSVEIDGDLVKLKN